MKATQESFAGHIDCRPYEDRANLIFSLLFAIALPRTMPKLFSTGNTTAPVMVHDYECQGAGRQLGTHIIKSGYHTGITTSRAAMLGLHALAATKEIVDGVGGQSQFTMIRGDKVFPVVPFDENAFDRHVLKYQKRTEELLLTIGDESVTKDQLTKYLQSFVDRTWEMKHGLENESAAYKDLIESLSKESQ